MPSPKNPIPNNVKYQPTSWAQQSPTFDLEMPSGQVCRVRRTTIQGLIQAGLLNDLDSLTGIVSDKFINRNKQVDIKALMADPAAIIGAISTVDKVVVKLVVEPEINLPPKNDDDRIEGLVYVDSIDIQDKMFIFQYVLGGTSSLEQFRAESDELMGGVDAGEPVAR